MIGEFHVRATIEGHAGEVTDLDWSPDGGALASAGRDGAVRVVQIARRASPELRWAARHDDEVLSVRFSRDGRYVASAGKDFVVRCWDARDGAPVHALTGPTTWLRVAWSPDQRYLAAADTATTIHVFDLEAGARAYLPHPRRVRQLQWLPDGTLLCGGDSGQLVLWTVEPQKSRTYPVAGQGILDLAVGRDRVVLAGRDGVLRLWSLTPLAQIGELPVGGAELRQAAFFLDDRFVAAIELGGRVTLHDRDARTLNCEFQPPPKVSRLAAHPARAIMAAAVERAVLLLDVDVAPKPKPVASAPVVAAPVVAAPVVAAPVVSVEPGATRDVGAARPGKASAGPPIRVVGGTEPAPLRVQGRADAPARILYLAANPSSETRLLLDQESAQIREVLDGATQRDGFVLDPAYAVRLDSLQKLLQQRPSPIVHFSGHGAADGSLMFVDRNNQATTADPRGLAEAFRLVGTRLVVLNACYSDAQADLLVQHVDAVVGMATEALDVTAIAFSKAFYESLGEGKDVRTAFEFARNYLPFNRLPGEEIPRLVLRGR